ncbi:NAD(P)-dependent oxidoreductase [Butyricicoccus faecihominis]|uniref:NAD-dependent epimerase/dehydratase family protein n=1 Tax=Butyricicoccus faecihominis TaxID=1712515 RepID=UPI002478FE83|nr:NAD(P)-dependent oxidoreductase [Butyricicoccus faecihominis]MCQ5128034.1 NAD(P)-dependent oxidoreductase [Butyricicoccus faecihominis]
MKRIAITGATGLIGTSLIRSCIKNQIEVLALLRPQSPRVKDLPRDNLLTIVPCALAELPTLDISAISCCDAFFHFGWEGIYGNARNDSSLQNANIQHTLDAVELAHRLHCKVFIGAGSQAEYGRTNEMLRADTPTFPESGYGIAKLAAGGLSRLHAHQLGMKHIWCRILSVYGIGDNPFTLIQSAIAAFLKGDAGHFTAGEQLWDYLYCDDAATALLKLAESGQDGHVYPLGSGQAHPLKEYIIKIAEACDNKVSPNLGARPYGENQLMYLCADTSDLIRDIGFHPQVDFDEGIRRTVEWYKTARLQK